MLLNSHTSAYATRFARKVCGLVRSTWGTSLGGHTLGARDRIFNTKVARRACAGQTFPLQGPSFRGPPGGGGPADQTPWAGGAPGGPQTLIRRDGQGQRSSSSGHACSGAHTARCASSSACLRRRPPTTEGRSLKSAGLPCPRCPLRRCAQGVGGGRGERGGGVGNVRYLEWRNLMRRKFSPDSSIPRKIWDKFSDRGTRTSVDRECWLLDACRYFLEAAGWLLPLPIGCASQGC